MQLSIYLETQVHEAVKRGDLKKVEYLVSKKFDINKRDKEGNIVSLYMY